MRSIAQRRAAFGFVALAAALAPFAAAAHSVEGAGDGFLAGFLHPILGPDHLVAMVAVGLWGAQLGQPLILALPIAFPMMMAVGALAAIAGGSLFGIVGVLEIGIAGSALMLGLAVAFAFRAPIWLAVTMVAFFAIFHGYAHGLELPNYAAPLPYGIGFVISTGLLHALGIAIGALNGWRSAGPLIVRACGVAIALLGGWSLLSALGVALAGATA